MHMLQAKRQTNLMEVTVKVEQRKTEASEAQYPWLTMPNQGMEKRAKRKGLNIVKGIIVVKARMQM